MGVPVRLRLSRAKGFDLRRASLGANGRDAVSVTRPGRWGNPFPVAPERTAEAAVQAFRDALLGGKLGYTQAEVKAALAGKNLACWCAPDAPCHADVLLAVANR